MALASHSRPSAALGALSMLLVSSGGAGADHGVPLGAERASPIDIGLLAGAAALGVGLALVAIAIRLARKRPRAP